MARERARIQQKQPEGASCATSGSPYERISRAPEARGGHRRGRALRRARRRRLGSGRRRRYEDNLKRGRPAKRRQHDLAAAGQEPVPVAASAATCARRRNWSITYHDRGAVGQAPHPRGLPERGRVGRRRVRRRGGGAPLLRRRRASARRRAVGAAGGDACRSPKRYGRIRSRPLPRRAHRDDPALHGRRRRFPERARPARPRARCRACA
ncbi:MAG: hypothetical protein MZW92_34220 [Comamonadaceae bacterium]|nr:hypothetical protein [Comamonadaceae bacterium]